MEDGTVNKAVDRLPAKLAAFNDRHLPLFGVRRITGPTKNQRQDKSTKLWLRIDFEPTSEHEPEPSTEELQRLIADLSIEERRTVVDILRSPEKRRALTTLVARLLILLALGACAFIAYKLYMRLRPAPGTGTGALPTDQRPTDPPDGVQNGFEFRRRGTRGLLITTTSAHEDDGLRDTGIRYFFDVVETGPAGAKRTTKLESDVPQVLYTSPFDALSGNIEITVRHTHQYRGEVKVTHPGTTVVVDWSEHLLPPKEREVTFAPLISPVDRKPFPQVIVSRVPGVAFEAAVVLIPSSSDPDIVEPHAKLSILGVERISTSWITLPGGHRALMAGVKFPPRDGTYFVTVDVGRTWQRATEVTLDVSDQGVVSATCRCKIFVTPDRQTYTALITQPD